MDTWRACCYYARRRRPGAKSRHRLEKIRVGFGWVQNVPKLVGLLGPAETKAALQPAPHCATKSAGSTCCASKYRGSHSGTLPAAAPAPTKTEILLAALATMAYPAVCVQGQQNQRPRSRWRRPPPGRKPRPPSRRGVAPGPPAHITTSPHLAVRLVPDPGHQRGTKHDGSDVSVPSKQLLRPEGVDVINAGEPVVASQRVYLRACMFGRGWEYKGGIGRVPWPRRRAGAPAVVQWSRHQPALARAHGCRCLGASAGSSGAAGNRRPPLSARHKGSTPRPTKKAGTLQPPAGSGRPAGPAPVAHLRAQGGAHLPEGQPEVLGHPEVAPLPELLQRRKGALRDRLRPGRVRQAPVRQPERLPQVQRVLAVVPCGKKEGEEGREGDGYLAATMRSMSAISASSTLRPPVASRSRRYVTRPSKGSRLPSEGTSGRDRSIDTWARVSQGCPRVDSGSIGCRDGFKVDGHLPGLV